ncbi:hypothetical protein J6590_071168 [Homalodisca vitripennis]|nr:hypothetical protein J6590_071168 [Homalodisca vitripennis]
MNWAKILKSPLEEVPLQHPISAAKMKDVSDLLTILFEQYWKDNPSLIWYKNIIVGSPSGPEDEEVECDCLEDDCADHFVILKESNTPLNLALATLTVGKESTRLEQRPTPN